MNSSVRYEVGLRLGWLIVRKGAPAYAGPRRT